MQKCPFFSIATPTLVLTTITLILFCLLCMCLPNMALTAIDIFVECVSPLTDMVAILRHECKHRTSYRA